MEFPDNLNELIRDENTSLPDGYSWNEMSRGIEDKMKLSTSEQIELTSSGMPFFNRGSFVALSVLVILVLLSLLTCESFYRDIEVQVPDFVHDSKQKSINTPQIQINEFNAENENTTQNGNAYFSAIDVVSEEINPSHFRTSMADQSTKESNISATTQGKNITSGPNNANFHSLPMKEEIKLAKNKNSFDTDNQVIVYETNLFEDLVFEYKELALITGEVRGNSNLDKVVIPRIPIMSIQKLDIVSNLPELPDNYPLKNVISWKDGLLYFSIGLGSNYFLPNWRSAESQQNYISHQSSIPGLSIAMNLEYVVSKNLALSSGLVWNEYLTRLDYQVSNDFERVKEDQLIQIITNSVTGLSTEVYGEATSTITQIREIRHFNRFRTIDLPITIRYYLRNSKISYGIGLGLSANLMAKTKGKYVYSESIQVYDKFSQLRKQSVSMNGLAEMLIRYDINNRLNVAAEFSISKPFSTWTIEDMVLLKPTMLRGQINLGYRMY